MVAAAGTILAIDQGTTSSRAILFGPDGGVLASARHELPQHYPASGWVEHDPEDIWAGVIVCCREAVAKARIDAAAIAAIGITNQRETTILWDRETGRAIHPAICWQDRRTAEICRVLRGAGVEPLVRERTGLRLDPYFSATKLIWLLENVDGARALARDGRLAFGTVDSFLLFRMTDGRIHATDATNAARTMLFNIYGNSWDEDLLRVFDIPQAILPEVHDCAGYFGAINAAHFGGTGPVAIRGVAGDQQAATLGEGCILPGMAKATYGTGCFAVLNTGEVALASANRLLTTIACRLEGRTTYALEGSVFVAGAAVQWLRDGLGLIESARHADVLANRADPESSAYLVPAFTGLGAPWWDADARGAVHGLTRATGRAELVRAALESVAYQTADLIDAMRADWGDYGRLDRLRVDGGMAASDWTMQFLSDILDLPVERAAEAESTAFGAAWLAGHAAGIWPDLDAFSATWRMERRFTPAMGAGRRAAKRAGWHEALRRTLSRG